MDTGYTRRLKSTSQWKNYWLFRETGKRRSDNRGGQKEWHRERAFEKEAKPCLFLISHQHSSSNDRSACKERWTKITPKGSRQYQTKIFCLLISPIVLTRHPDGPSTMDRKNISRPGDFLKKRIRLKRRIRQRRTSEFTSAVIYKLFSLILSCFSRIKAEMWIPV